jgi:hypothetical protein
MMFYYWHNHLYTHESQETFLNHQKMILVNDLVLNHIHLYNVQIC